MSVRASFAPARRTAAGSLTVRGARAAVYRWLWAQQQGSPFIIAANPEPWREELQWLGLEAEEANPSPREHSGLRAGEPSWLGRLPEILPGDSAPWGVGAAETPIADLRWLGVLPEALVNFLALLGWQPPDGASELFSRTQLARLFDPQQIVSTPVAFDAEKLRALNHHWLQQADLDRLLALSLPYFLAAGYLPEDPPEPVRLWLKDVIRAVLPGLDFLSLLPQRTRFVFDYSAARALEFPESRAALERAGARDVIREFGGRVLEENWLTRERLAAIVEEVRKAMHGKGRSLLQPVRVMLTGLPFGPELADLIPIFETGSQLNLAMHVKSCRERVLEFCSVFV